MLLSGSVTKQRRLKWRSTRTTSSTLSRRPSKKATLYWSRETRQRRKVTHRITRYRGLSSRPKGLRSLQKMPKASLLRETLRSLRACSTSRPPVKGKRTPTVMVFRRGSMLRLRNATPSLREHVCWLRSWLILLYIYLYSVATVYGIVLWCVSRRLSDRCSKHVH